ncbi:efflux RND transporter periplasmic adaptor subunit [Aestuariibius insulae]|uniref:efflux RND transporter periplasmic adaptor subunit n=1 Tax=Aestuariibius insulae TaxID=2058287 RepID=UPI00345EDFBA
MRFFPLITAAVVTAFLYLLVFERQALLAFAQAATGATEESTELEDEIRRVSVVAIQSDARTVEDGLVIRGETEAIRDVVVQSEISGLVLSEPLRKGALVEEGQLLCQLDPGTREASLAEARAGLTEARTRVPEAEARLSEADARIGEAQIELNAAQRLSEGGFASETRVASAQAAYESAQAGQRAADAGVSAAQSSIESAEAAVAAAEKDIERLSIRAPFAGLLETDTAERGSLLQPGSTCATVIQLNPIKLVGFVPETQVNRIDVGATAGARLASGREVTGKVTFISRSADDTTRTFRVEINVDNEDLLIRDGQTAEIVVQSDGVSAHLVPQSAMTLNDEGVLGLRVVSEDDTALFQPITIVRDTINGVWITGLEDRADIIVVGHEFVIDGVPVQVTYRQTDSAAPEATPAVLQPPEEVSEEPNQ